MVRHAALSDLRQRWLMYLMLFLDDYQYLWHTREEIEAAEQAEKAAKQAAEEEARQRALYEDEALLADVVRMLDGDGTIYGPEQEQGVAGAEQLARDGDKADV